MTVPINIGPTPKRRTSLAVEIREFLARQPEPQHTAQIGAGIRAFNWEVYDSCRSMLKSNKVRIAKREFVGRARLVYWELVPSTEPAKVPEEGASC